MSKNFKRFKHVQIFTLKRCNKVPKIRTECYEKRNMKIKSIWKCIFQQVLLIFFAKVETNKTKKILSKQVKRHKENIKEQTRHR